MKILEPKNVNYCCTATKITNIVPFENCANLVGAKVCGCQVIVSKESSIGDKGLFFPLECELSKDFLSNNNLYTYSDKNVDKSKSGYFKDNGRLRAVKLRGHRSEGLFMPLESLSYILTKSEIESIKNGQDFDALKENTICKKYVVYHKQKGVSNNNKDNSKFPTRLVEDQFRLHKDTAQLKKNLELITSNQLISITKKLHGTSAVFGNVLVQRKPSFIGKIASLLGCSIKNTEYGFVFSSRNVVKNSTFKSEATINEDNPWGQWSARLRGKIPIACSIYVEIVGYTPQGSPIQKNFDYGVDVGESEMYVYRVTYTMPSGEVVELAYPALSDFCEIHDFKAVPLLYYGKAKNLYTDIEVGTEEWLEKLYQDKDLQMGDSDCSMHTESKPSEGIVIRTEGLIPRAYKLKNFRFLEAETKALDKGISNIEDQN